MSDNDVDIFDYDAGLDEILNELPTVAPLNDAANTSKDADAPDTATPVLGLDADLKATKQRVPTAKLDESRYVLNDENGYEYSADRMGNYGKQQSPFTEWHSQVTKKRKDQT